MWSNVDYTLAESPNPGTNYTASAWTCKDEQNATVAVDAGKVKVNSGQDVTCTITNTYTPPGIDVVKTADPAGPVAKGTKVKYSYTVTNTGISPLSNVTVTDAKCKPEFVSGDANDNSELDTTETWLYTCSATLEQTTTNTVIATGYDPEEKKVEDQDEVTVKVLPASMW
ncbi:MAG: hypothetical protein IPN52_14365 [Micrococcales bacterium]|nr:hypothetical protein [Micrococcales bacterium]